MTPVSTADLPAPIRTIALAAERVGWSLRSTLADGVLEGVRRKVDGEFKVIDEPVRTIAVRFGHERFRAYGVWRVDAGVSFEGGASRQCPPGVFTTLRALKAYLGVA